MTDIRYNTDMKENMIQAARWIEDRLLTVTGDDWPDMMGECTEYIEEKFGLTVDEAETVWYNWVTIVWENK